MRKIKKWKLLEEKDVSPSPWFPLFKHRVRLPNGKVVDDYYISKLGDVAMILTVTRNKEVVFVNQYKHGAGEVMVELPAGRIREGNTALEEAITELREETGYIADKMEHFGTVVLAPSKDTSRTHCFIVTDVEIQKKQKLDETEEIEVVLVPVKEVDEWIKLGKIKAADTIACLKLAQLKFPKIFQ
jgi:ADP-ribose pyrophosphatase